MLHKNEIKFIGADASILKRKKLGNLNPSRYTTYVDVLRYPKFGIGATQLAAATPGSTHSMRHRCPQEDPDSAITNE